MFGCYLRKGIVYLPTMGKVEPGFYMHTEPVAVVPVSDTADLRRALADTLRRGNPRVVAPPRHLYPPPLILKYAGVKSYSTFTRGASAWHISKERTGWEIVGQRKGSSRGWVNDPEQKVRLAPEAGIDEVCDRMVEILQERARTA
jgi:hypothetical protein